MSDVVVVGAGLVGVCAAYRLAGAGAQVTVVDRGDAGQATAAGAGIISPGSGFPDGPLLRLATSATAYYPRLLAELAADGEERTGYAVVGVLLVAADDDEAALLPGALRQLRQRRAAGLSHVGEATAVDPDQARGMFPALGPLAAAVHIPGAARVDGRQLRDAVERAGRRRGVRLLRGGAQLRVGRGRAGVHVDGRAVPADAVIVAGGAWSGALAERLGLHLPVYPQRGQIAHLLLPGADTGSWPIVLGFGAHYLLTFPPDRVVAGATWEHDAGFDHRVTVAGAHEILGQALRLAPGLAAGGVHEIRVGFRPASPDGMPVIGAAPGLDNLYFVTGHGGSGLQLGPWSGAAVADLAVGGTVTAELRPFAADRFAGT